ncbi:MULTISPECIES: DinB family protein [Bacillus]|uniref:DinB family protein n=1 Tax=Bacillus TaxID=1386 RepID=UPI000BB6D76C|nr:MULTISPECIES: DinB family protein [Bacillus]
MKSVIQQYAYIKQSREVLFSYLESVSPQDLVQEHISFSGKSLIELHLHVAKCYETWISRFLNEEKDVLNGSTPETVSELRSVFHNVNQLVEEFFQKAEGELFEEQVYSFSNGREATFSPLWLFTHVTTHEYHHKGQIVSLGKQLGYKPPLTDLVNIIWND